MEDTPDCNEHARLARIVGDYQYPPWVTNHNPINTDPDALICDEVHRHELFCQVKRRNNPNHPDLAHAPLFGDVPMTTRWTVCDGCNLQITDMINADRWRPPGQVPNAWQFFPSQDNVFRDVGTHHATVIAQGALPHVQLGAHRIGRLCTLCEDTEIDKYYQRCVGGVRRQTEEQAANTCKCEAFLNKRLCFQDKEDYLKEVERKSARNAALPDSWLAWLYYDENLQRPRWARTTAARNAVQAARHNPESDFERNACRCGREIQLTPQGEPVRYRNNTPRPVAMCTACDGIIIDVRSARVRDWPNFNRTNRPATLPLREQGNLKLGRRVEEV